MKMLARFNDWLWSVSDDDEVETLTLRAWTEDPALSAEQKRHIEAYLTLPRSKQRRVYTFIRHMKGKAA